MYLYSFLLDYSYRNASMGFRLAAFTDGIQPNKIPTIIENNTATAAAAGLMATGTSASLAMILDKPIPATTPSRPPTLVKTAASVRN